MEKLNQEALKKAHEYQKKLMEMAADEREKLRLEEERRLRLIAEAVALAQWKVDNYIYEYDKEKYDTTFEFV